MAAGSTPSGPGSNSPVKIFANIFIAFIGAGVLGLPYAFKEAGILEGILTMTCVAVISTKAMLLIIDCKYKILGKKVRGIPMGMAVDMDSRDQQSLIPSEVTGTNHGDFSRQEQDLMISIKEPRAGPKTDISYGDVGFQALGHIGRVLVDIAIVISQTGFCCAYIIFISENLSDYFKGVRIGEWLLILLPPLFFLTLLRHLSSLAMSSLLAQLSNLMAFGVVFWFDFEHLFKITLHVFILWKMMVFPSCITACPLHWFSLAGAASVFLPPLLCCPAYLPACPHALAPSQVSFMQVSFMQVSFMQVSFLQVSFMQVSFLQVSFMQVSFLQMFYLQMFFQKGRGAAQQAHQPTD
ncbi:hypothetical protein ACOMHN_011294 [Nucella lapillus]